MSHPLQHPIISRLIDRVARVFSQEDVYLTVDRHLLFVCGGPVRDGDDSLRKQFLSYAADFLPNFRVFLAEAAAIDIFTFSGPHFLDLIQFEDFIASYSDCIILFPESPGALAEIGFFAASSRIRPKLLVANDLVMQAADSFINNGPLAQVNAHSAFRPVIHLDRDRLPIDFSPIKQRLQRFPSKQRHRFSFASYDTLAPIARISTLLEIVNLFWPISIDGILFIINRIFGNAVLNDLQHILSLTVAVEYLRRVGDIGDLFALHANAKTLLDFDDTDELTRMRLSVIDFYRQHHDGLYRLIGTRSV